VSVGTSKNSTPPFLVLTGCTLPSLRNIFTLIHSKVQMFAVSLVSVRTLLWTAFTTANPHAR